MNFLKKIWHVILAISAVLGAILTLKAFRGKKDHVVSAEPTKKEVEAIDKATDALLERAKVEAIAGEQKKRVDKIMEIEDPRERLRRLAEELKDL
jgi:hypothetical protein